MSQQLRPYQTRAVDEVRASYASGSQAVLLVLPTAAGKTTVASELCRGRGRVLWVAHRSELMAQAADRLKSFGVTDPIVASIQSLTAPGAEVPACDFAVFDECHHLPKDAAWSNVAETLRARGVLSLGLTATPQRGDGRGLRGTFDSLVVGATAGELVAEGYLSSVDVYCTGVARKNGMAMTPRAAWELHGEGRRTVVFCRTVSEATELRDQWGDGEVIHGKLGARERARRLATSWRVLFNVYVLTEGWDAPSVKCAILARGCGTLGLYLQIAGRILRPHEGQTALLIDLMGSSVSHGHPLEPHVYSLDGKGIRGAGERGFAACAACGFLISVDDDFCDRCGHPQESASKKAAKALFITNEKLRKLELAAKADRIVKIASLADWVRLGQARKYKPGFPAARFNEKYGAYPSRAERSEADAMLRQALLHEQNSELQLTGVATYELTGHDAGPA